MTILVCPTCGSADVSKDACARWDSATNAWELSSTYDVMTCDDCGDEFYELDEIEEAQLPPADERCAKAEDAAKRTAEAGCALSTAVERYLAWTHLKELEDNEHHL